MGGIYGEVCTKKGIYQGKRRLCGIVLSRFLPPQANRPELHGQEGIKTPTEHWQAQGRKTSVLPAVPHKWAARTVAVPFTSLCEGYERFPVFLHSGGKCF